MIGNGQIKPATPEQNKQAEVVLSNIEEFLLDEEVHAAIVQKMGEGEPADTIGQIAGQLVHMQVMVAEGSIFPPPLGYLSRQRPIGSKFSKAKPSGSILR